MNVKRIEYIGEGCSLWVESNQLDGIYHLMITEFKLDANRDIEDEFKFGTVLSIEEMKEFHQVLSEAIDHQERILMLTKE
ncbi:hypothetical protein ACQKEY_11200 [Lysinibacillus fusiformis]|uniref:hypothetical protein n=1 Tax=Lysinibacillus fusiformis TaxID=28031 RepID=UPI003CFCAFF8